MADACRPRVSVVIPCFNQARFLPAALASVARQSYPFVETLVVDDGSTDGSSSLATRAGVGVIRQRNRGVSDARNVGLAVASGEFVVFLDADDELMDGALVAAATRLATVPTADCLVGQCLVMDSDGHPRPAPVSDVNPADLYRTWLSSNFVWTPGAAMFRRVALTAIGGFPPRVGPAADYAVYLELARARRVLYEPRPLVRYRQHADSMSRDPVRMLRATLAVLRRESRVTPPGYAAELRTGVRTWRNWYGEQIIERLRSRVRGGRLCWKDLVLLWTLLWHCPETAMYHARRKARLVIGAAPARRGQGA